MPVIEVASSKRTRHKLISRFSRYVSKSLIKSTSINTFLINRLKKKREKLDYYEKEFTELGHRPKQSIVCRAPLVSHGNMHIMQM